ncbi:MAG: pyrimidine 5'-nucleotidase [Deltaproteobacteria bacterium RBG_16_54_11]|jgi:putative hydrolase of the HAD superfamily|nr:MAG: pyrimidine 5'-nucleotidase [Deltaproteobacteria bacterium RBG_16_54_11]
MKTRYILFDLDNTLYPRECGLFHLIEERIKEYLRSRLGLTQAEAADLRRRYLREYGFTLVGLMKHQAIDPEDYLAFVHEVDVEGVLAEDRGLAQLMSRIPLTKVIVTNGTERHAQRVIRSLGVEPFFSHIFDIAFMGYCPKPHLSTFHRVLDHLGVTGEECLMLDDYPPTLATARALGMTTIYVGEAGQAAADYQIGEIKGLEKVLRDLQLFDARDVVQ